MLGPKRKYFQTATDKNSSEQLRKLEKIKPFGHSKAPKKKKLGQILLIFPVLGKTTHMGQFLQDGKNVRFMSLFFKKWMARAAKPSDIDDFFRFAVTYHDFGMPLK